MPGRDGGGKKSWTEGESLLNPVSIPKPRGVHRSALSKRGLRFWACGVDPSGKRRRLGPARLLAPSALLAFLLTLSSCAPWQITGRGQKEKETVSRTYSIEYGRLHPQVHSALQEYARSHRGTSFQIVRLGNSGVTFRGTYLDGPTQQTFRVEIHIRPGGRGKARMELNLFPLSSGGAEKLVAGAGNLVRIIEKGAGLIRTGERSRSISTSLSSDRQIKEALFPPQVPDSIYF